MKQPLHERFQQLAGIKSLSGNKLEEIQEFFSKPINESKGAALYFEDLKYYYQKSLRYLDADEREEYKTLAKNFFSKLLNEDNGDELLNKEKITNHITYQGDGPVNKPTAVSRAFELYKHGSDEDIIIGVLIDVLEEIDRDGDIESNEY